MLEALQFGLIGPALDAAAIKQGVLHELRILVLDGLRSHRLQVAQRLLRPLIEVREERIHREGMHTHRGGGSEGMREGPRGRGFERGGGDARGDPPAVSRG